MTMRQVNYDQIAPEYDQRFASEDSSGREEAIGALASRLEADRILEVGCGTGHWLAYLQPVARHAYGLDASAGMLHQAQQQPRDLNLARGYARHLPYESNSFNLVFCVNAIHHFAEPQAFVEEAFRILGWGGVLAIAGSDPHRQHNTWYVYDYFEGTYETDLQRFPSWREVQQWMVTAGLQEIELREVERISDTKIGRDVLHDPYLRKNACSQLALLTDDAYASGVRGIEAALTAAEATGETTVFPAELSVEMMTGCKRKSS
jgi:ubiquinone/menaquinone biosynthesis C-methylase UbiE